MYLATVMLLGSGELGREFAIAAKRLDCRVIACDRYANAPAMQVADAFAVFSMLDGASLRAAVEQHKPDVIVPEIEAIDTATLAELETAGAKVAFTQADVGTEAACLDFVNGAAQKFGRLDILINNAGIRKYEKVDEASAASWKEAGGDHSASRAAITALSMRIPSARRRSRSRKAR